MAEAGALTERLANDKGIDAFLLRDTLVELAYLRRKLGEAESAEIDFKAEIERLHAAITGAMDQLSNGDTEGGARVLRECFWGIAPAPESRNG